MIPGTLPNDLLLLLARSRVQAREEYGVTYTYEGSVPWTALHKVVEWFGSLGIPSLGGTYLYAPNGDFHLLFKPAANGVSENYVVMKATVS